jgi:hypothetical protein
MKQKNERKKKKKKKKQFVFSGMSSPTALKKATILSLFYHRASISLAFDLSVYPDFLFNLKFLVISSTERYYPFLGLIVILFLFSLQMFIFLLQSLRILCFFVSLFRLFLSICVCTKIHSHVFLTTFHISKY